MLTTHAHLAPNLRMRQAMPLFLLYAFMALRETNWIDFTIQKKCLRKPGESHEQAQTSAEHTWNATALHKRQIGPSTWATTITIASLRILLKSTITLSIDDI